MGNFEYKHLRFKVQAKRKNGHKWTEWTEVDTYEDAVMHAKRAEEAGFDARIVDRGERNDNR